MSTWWVDYKKMQKNIFSRWLFEIIHIIRFEIHMDRLDVSKKIFLSFLIMNHFCYYMSMQACRKQGIFRPSDSPAMCILEA